MNDILSATVICQPDNFHILVREAFKRKKNKKCGFNPHFFYPPPKVWTKTSASQNDPKVSKHILGEKKIFSPRNTKTLRKISMYSGRMSVGGGMVKKQHVLKWLKMT